tara:strand:+ start:1695 stop:1961 length:267 start_codon:yes stop_codon:yes gene_type:complete
MLTIKLKLIPESLNSYYITNVNDIRKYKMHNFMTIADLSKEISVSARVLQIALDVNEREWKDNYPKIGIQSIKQCNKETVKFIVEEEE